MAEAIAPSKREVVERYLKVKRGHRAVSFTNLARENIIDYNLSGQQCTVEKNTRRIRKLDSEWKKM